MTVLFGCATGYAATLGAVSAPVPQSEEAQKSVLGQDIVMAWWQLFQSPQIDNLLKRAFKTHPDIGTAQAALQKVREYSAAYHGFFYPVDAANDLPEPQGEGMSAPTNSSLVGGRYNGPVYYNFHIERLTVGYVPDVLVVKPAEPGLPQDLAEMKQMQLEATYITLASNVVAAAMQHALLEAQIEAQLKIVSLNQQALEIVRNQLKLGYVTEKDVTQQEMTSARAQQELTPLQQQLEQTRELLRKLAGPDEDVEGTDMTDRDVEDVFSLDSLHLLQELPSSLQSRLVQQRPDVRIADARLHSASAQHGVAIVHTMPQFAVAGAKDGMAASPAWMARNGGDFFLNGEVAQFVFDKKKLSTRSPAANRELRQAATQYRSVVMVALQNVADTLRVIQSDERAFKSAEKAAQAASKLGGQTREQYQDGSVDFHNLLVAQQNEQFATIKLLQAQTNRLGDAVALFQALGGGWWGNGSTDKTVAKHH